MANKSLSDIASVINVQIDTQELLSEHLCKLEAILRAASAERFFEYETFTLQHYLWAICDMTVEMKKMNEQALSSMLKSRNELGYM